jgi:hypothetical protein
MAAVVGIAIGQRLRAWVLGTPARIACSNGRRVNVSNGAKNGWWLSKFGGARIDN